MDVNRIKELYEKHQSLKIVAKELGCSAEGIRKTMLKDGILINKRIRYSFNERFFSVDNEASFYWAGFIAADGNLYRKTLTIGLSLKDKCHLERFKSDICATYPIRDSIVVTTIPSGKTESYGLVKISLCSEYLPVDLARFNIVPNKTKIYTFPNWIINHPLVHHFIRGYVDGDGCWTFKGRDQLYFSVVGTADFLKACRSILEKKCDLKENTKEIRSIPGTSIIQYGGNRIASKIRDFLYHEATIFLQRKFDIVKDVTAVKRISVTPEYLINRMTCLGKREMIAEELGCSVSNIHRYVKSFDISHKMHLAKLSFKGDLHAR